MTTSNKLPEASRRNLRIGSSSRSIAIGSGRPPTSDEAIGFAKTLRGLFPTPLPDEAGYIASVSMMLTRYGIETIERLIDPGGIALAHDFPPTLKQIADWIEGPLVHKWSDGTVRRQREWVCSTPAYQGPNFTRERLAEEAALRAQGIEPEDVPYRSRERVEHLGDRDLHWLTHPDPDAWWRKPSSPSRELMESVRMPPEEQSPDVEVEVPFP